MRHVAITLCFTMLLLGSNTALSQNKWSAEFRPGINFPTQEINDSELNTGFGFEVKVSYHLMPHLSAYGGWGWNQFKLEERSFGDPKIDLEETGYTFGFELTIPRGTPPISFFVNAGGVYNHFEFENNQDGTVIDSDHGMGWQVGGGMAYEFIENWFLRPELRYRSLSRDYTVANTPVESSLRYVGFGIGVAATF
ncbi:outer membrane beta-barrel protein [Altibacter sp.]|uniref:outer membrane beta-barrel protein n=1 Tax=Altibacter sp. TaxID=2024823 RepID=UPI00259050C3|nr:outer membrane beta-barrel protein [Altibacter sp.]MCW9037849.1 porin family protein [Altibacter sp.]